MMLPFPQEQTEAERPGNLPECSQSDKLPGQEFNLAHIFTLMFPLRAIMAN